MKNKIIKRITIVIFIAMFSVVFGCSKNNETSGGDIYLNSDQGFPEVNAAAVHGDIVIAGSSTVYPLAERLADMFREEGYDGNIEISSIGSGAGFERWAVQGETDISNASRPIKQKEVDAAKSIGRDPIEFKIGTDALAIVVNTENTWLDNVTEEEIAKIFTSENWSDVNPAWPQEAILKFSPGTDSGTFDYFVEKIFHKKKEPLLNAPNIQLSEDDNILSRGVQGNKNAIGYFGYAYYEEQADYLKILKIDGVEASSETVGNSSYPLARPLFMYSSKSVMQEKTQVAAFLAYVLANVNDVIVDVGYFPEQDAVLNRAKEEWLEATQE